MNNVKFGVLGPVRVWRGAAELGTQRPQAQAILAALLLREGAPATLDELIDGLWGCSVPRTARNAVRNYISGFRHLLGDREAEIIRTVGGGYALVASAATFDLAHSKALFATARAARDTGDLTTAMARYVEALALWAGPPLAGVPGPYAAAQRAQLDELRLSGIEEHIACSVDAGLHARVLPTLSALVRDYPLHERFRELHMRALQGAGRQAEAFSSYREANRLSREELGVAPGPGLRETYQRILDADSTSASVSRSRSLREPSLESGARPGAGSETIAPAQLPAALPWFIGRERELDLVADPAEPDEGTGAREQIRCTVIHGMAGIGKTAFAVRWAREIAPRFPDGQLFADLRGLDPTTDGPDPADVLADFLVALGTSATDVPASRTARAALYRSMLAGRRVLIVLDDARDEAQVRPLLPGNDGCSVIITSRNRLSGLAGTHQSRLVAMPPLDKDEARELIMRAAGPRRLNATDGALDEIVSRCAGLPLALSVMAARIALLPCTPLSVIAAELGSVDSVLDAFSPCDDPATDVRAVFSRSYQALDVRCARLFRFLSLHPGPEITVSAASRLAAMPASDARLLLARLAANHLVEEDAPGRYSLHPLLRAHAAELSRMAEGVDERLEAVERLVDLYSGAAESAALALEPSSLGGQNSTPADVENEAPGDSSRALLWFARERRTVLALVEHAADSAFDRHAWRLASAMDRYLATTGQRAERLSTRRSALQAVMRARQGNASVCAEAHLAISLLFEWERAFRDALVHAQRAVRLHTAAGNAEGRARGLTAVGRYQGLLGEHDRSLAHCRRALREPTQHALQHVCGASRESSGADRTLPEQRSSPDLRNSRCQ